MPNPNLDLALLVQQRRLSLEQIPDLATRQTVRSLLHNLSDAQIARLAAAQETTQRRHLGRSTVHSRR